MTTQPDFRTLRRRRDRQIAIFLVLMSIAFFIMPFFIGPPPVTLMLCALFTVLFFCLWVGGYRDYRLIHDLPTSRIASAAQGYVELFGRTAMIPGKPLSSPLSRQPCCWYSFTLRRQYRSEDGSLEWAVADHGSSTEPFLIVDETGVCVILPEEARHLGAHGVLCASASWMDGDRHCSESLLLPGVPIYGAGEFSTESDVIGTRIPALGRAEVDACMEAVRNDRVRERDKLQEKADSAGVSALLARWKADRKQLNERFDLDRDGTIDMEEWERARLEARREVRRRQSLPREEPEGKTRINAVDGTHVLRAPRDGRPFLLGPVTPDVLATRNRIAVWTCFLLCLYYAAWVIAMLLRVRISFS